MTSIFFLLLNIFFSISFYGVYGPTL
jgi:hypothetical protein